MEKRYTSVILALFVAVSFMVHPLTVNASSQEIVVLLNQYALEYSVLYYDTEKEEFIYKDSGYHDLANNNLTMTMPSQNNVSSVQYRVDFHLPLTSSQLERISNADSVDIIVKPKSMVGGSSVEGFYSWGNGTTYDGSSQWSASIIFGYDALDNSGYTTHMESYDQSSSSGNAGRNLTNKPKQYNTAMFKGKMLKDIDIFLQNVYWPANNNYLGGTARLVGVEIQLILNYSDSEQVEKAETIYITNSLDNIQNSITDGFGSVVENQNTEISQNAQMIQQNMTIIDKIQSGFASVGESVKTGVTNAVNELFVPSEESVQEFFINMNEMEEEHLKPIAQVKDTVNTIEQTLFNPEYDAQISGDLAPVAGYINTVQGDGVFIFPGYEMKLKEGNFPLWEDYVIDVGATLDDMGLSWIPTVTKAICTALFTWRFLIMVLRWLMKITENPTFGQWADMLATFDFNYKTGW